MDPEAPAGGGLMQSKIMGIPSIVWIGGIGLIVYFLFFRNSSSSSGSSGAQAGTPTGGSGTITSGDTTIDSGAVQVTVEGANNSPGATQSQQQSATDAAGSGTGSTSTQTQPSPPTTGTTTTTGSSGGSAGGGTVTVPNVVGSRVNPAIAKLVSSGLAYHLSQVRNPKDEYSVNSQTPGAGTKVNPGATIDLGIQTPPAK
jgi:hypothetical protein